MAAIGIVIGALVIVVLTARSIFSTPRYRGPVSDHFDGRVFRNRGHNPAGFRELIAWLTHRERGAWRDRIEAEPGPPPPERVGDGRIRVTFVGHSTVLIQMDGVNILTDPVWSDRVSPVSWTGPRRHRPPGLRFEDLPPIDLVLLSHNHYDHMDLPTLRRLVADHRPRIVAPLGNTAFLDARKIPGCADLDWWGELSPLPGLKLTCVPAEHFSGRGMSDRDTSLWAGYVIESPAGRICFAGDTGFGPHFAEIGSRFGSFRLALLPIGAYRPRGFMGPVHMGPDDAVRVHEIVNAATSVGIHFGTFSLADDGETEPVEEVAKAVAERPEPRPRFLALAEGEGREV